MKIVAEISRLSNGVVYPSLYCIDEVGGLVVSVTNTLLDIVSEMWPPMMEELEELFSEVERGRYVPDNPNLPDWGVNDKNIWFNPPGVDKGYILISNEYSEEFSEEYGQPQLFSIDQFRAAFKFWTEFRELCNLKGEENMLGKKVYGVL